MRGRRFGSSGEIHALDTERIVRALAARNVDYVLIGGLAALAHGSTLATADADVLPRPDVANLERLLDALEDLDAAVLIGELRRATEAGEPWEVEELAAKGADALIEADAWHFTTAAGPIDVVVRVTGVGPYEAHAEAIEEREAFGARVLVASLDDLIASKAATHRPKDEAILRELRELRERDEP